MRALDFLSGVLFGLAVTWLVLQWLAGADARGFSEFTGVPPVEVNGVY